MATTSATFNMQQLLFDRWSHYGATCLPFSDHVRYTSFFKTQAWSSQQQAFNLFLDSPQSPILLLTGAKGTGRATLLDQLLLQHPKAENIIRFMSQSDTTLAMLQQRLLKLLIPENISLQPSDADLNLSHILSHVDEKKLHFIVFYNADRLSWHVQAELMMAINNMRQLKHANPIKFIFLAEPGFQKRINFMLSSRTKDFFTHIKTGLIAKEEVRDYLHHCLVSAGVDARYRLKQEKITSLLQEASYTYAKLNQLFINHFPADLFESQRKRTIVKKQANAIRAKINLKTLNRFVLRQCVWLLGVGTLSYALLHYRPQINFAHFMFSRQYAGALISGSHLAALQRPAYDMFRPNSGYNLSSMASSATDAGPASDTDAADTGLDPDLTHVARNDTGDDVPADTGADMVMQDGSTQADDAHDDASIIISQHKGHLKSDNV